MDTVIYGSKYGSAKKYAQEVSEKTGFELKSYDEVNDINSFNTIIYIGSLYAGGVTGMQKTFKKLTKVKDKKIIIATVGIADPENKENTDHIKDGMKGQLSEEVFDHAKIFHLRGAIDYSKLSFKHSMMMKMLVKMVVAKLPEEKQNAETEAMLETYNKQVDFIDFETLKPLLECV